ncbi:Tryptophan synthase beta chain [Roseomonas mucosa]|nr:Tryptophan synthase beta chain [Roseomonas mucosa]
MFFFFSGDPRLRLLPGIGPQAGGHHGNPRKPGVRGPAPVPGGEGGRRERRCLFPGGGRQAPRIRGKLLS